MIIDLSRCVGCHTCSVACRAAWQVPLPHQRNWVQRLGPSNTSHGMAHTFYPGQCNHCIDPPCVPVCPVDRKEKVVRNEQTGEVRTIQVTATWKDPFTGTVLIDNQRCIGCGACVTACPYKARFLNDQSTVPRAEACNFCLPLLDENTQPVCVASCPTDARIFGDLKDPDTPIARMVREQDPIRLEPTGESIGPNVQYIGTAKDLELLQARCRPAAVEQPNIRRSLLGALARPIRNTATTGQSR